MGCPLRRLFIVFECLILQLSATPVSVVDFANGEEELFFANEMKFEMDYCHLDYIMITYTLGLLTELIVEHFNLC